MAIGIPGVDSSVVVTTVLGGKTLVELAFDMFGEAPAFWGRYFTSLSTLGADEYRGHRENQILRDQGSRVLPIARQTLRVDGSQTNGDDDARLNVQDVIGTFGKNYLASQGGEFLLVLDVEGAPSLSPEYYLGWATTVDAFSTTFSGGLVHLIPCVYGTQADGPTWHAVATACTNGATCGGIWIARWRHHGCAGLPVWDDSLVQPGIDLPCDVFAWQYADECHGGDGIDLNELNPRLDADALLAQMILPPETP